MTFRPDSLEQLKTAPFDTVIDVRSPSEYAEDHVPGSVNLPVLDDSERARVGAIYVQKSAFLARKIGAALVARNAARHIEGPLAERDGGWRPLVYCWRGGQRSNSFAAILSQIGWRVAVLEGGYQTYRRLVKRTLYDAPFPARVVLLDGFTGTAKTDLLHGTAQAGAQVIDLEGLAGHRGSLFGARGAQPAQKGFESKLAEIVRDLDPGRPVLVEAESSKVGERIVPPSLWAAMRTAPRITVEAPLAVRAAYLQGAYADLVRDTGRLDRLLGAMTRLQGRERVAAWRGLLKEGRMEDLAAALMKHHYDPRYAKQRSRDAAAQIGVLTAERLDPDEIASLSGRIAEMLEPARAGA